MALNYPRVAYFPDSFHEINGVAHTSRHFEAFARRRNLPFLCVRAGDRAQSLVKEGNLWTLELPRGIFSFALEKDLRYDPAYLRHLPVVAETIEAFQPELIHITGPSELGTLGLAISDNLDLPLAASWHTNVHEYLARRTGKLLNFLPDWQTQTTEKTIQDATLSIATLIYSAANVLFAPNVELCHMLEQAIGKRCHLMPRGVDTELFHPAKREQGRRHLADDTFVLGFVGRLSVEKNVALLIDIQRQLIEAGRTNFRFLIVGHGNEEELLKRELTGAEFPGVLKGEALSAAYAAMDLFVFPSHTDTFGNVVLEALASGVPAVVTPEGGPRYIIRDAGWELQQGNIPPSRSTGRIAHDADFARAIQEIMAAPEVHRELRVAAREYALTASWDSVFEGVYAAYAPLFPYKNRE